MVTACKILELLMGDNIRWSCLVSILLLLTKALSAWTGNDSDDGYDDDLRLLDPIFFGGSWACLKLIWLWYFKYGTDI